MSAEPNGGRPWPRLTRAERRRARRFFLRGLLHPDAAQHALVVVVTDAKSEAAKATTPPP